MYLSKFIYLSLDWSKDKIPADFESALLQGMQLCSSNIVLLSHLRCRMGGHFEICLTFYVLVLTILNDMQDTLVETLRMFVPLTLNVNFKNNIYILPLFNQWKL